MIGEDLDFLFTELGATLVFDSFNIPSLQSFLEYLNPDQNSFIYETNRRIFDFHVRTSDLLTKEILVGDQFSYSDGVNTYLFEVTNSPQPDFTGLSRFTSNYIGLN